MSMHQLKPHEACRRIKVQLDNLIGNKLRKMRSKSR